MLTVALSFSLWTSLLTTACAAASGGGGRGLSRAQLVLRERWQPLASWPATLSCVLCFSPGSSRTSCLPCTCSAANTTRKHTHRKVIGLAVCPGVRVRGQEGLCVLDDSRASGFHLEGSREKADSGQGRCLLLLLSGLGEG